MDVFFQASYLVSVMPGQPTTPAKRVPLPEIRPYDQGLLTVGFP